MAKKKLLGDSFCKENHIQSYFLWNSFSLFTATGVVFMILNRYDITETLFEAVVTAVKLGSVG